MPLIAVNGTSLHYRFDGAEQGPVVMLSNSLATNLSMWDLQVPVLVGAGYRVLRYDSRGHGQSAAPKGPYSIEMLAEDAVALMDALGLGEVHFCGLSKGGMVGQMLGTRHGDRLISLVLCDTAAHMTPREFLNELIEAVRKGGMASMVDAHIGRWFSKAGQERLPAEVDKVRSMILNTPVDGYCSCCEAIRDMDQRESIREITAPTLVIVGEQDPSTPVEAARLIHERIAGSKLVILSGAAHLTNVEQAEAFNEALLSFLQP